MPADSQTAQGKSAWPVGLLEGLFVATPLLAVVFFGARTPLQAAPFLMLLSGLIVLLMLGWMRDGGCAVPVDALCFLPFVLWMGWWAFVAQQAVPAQRVFVAVALSWLFYVVARTLFQRHRTWTPKVLAALTVLAVGLSAYSLWLWVNDDLSMLWLERLPQWAGRPGDHF